MAQATLQKKYTDEVVPNLKEKFGVKNALALPRLEKIVVNMGVGEAISDMKILDSAVQTLEMLTGQKALITKSKKAISNFKLRENMPIGCKVTLRRERMYEFMERLFAVTLPRIRDFNGVSKKSFDKQGNYTLGLSEQSIFPEVDPGRIKYTHGMDITFVFDKGPTERTHDILKQLGMPFKK